MTLSLRRSRVYAPQMSVGDADGPSGRLAELRVSARGWHGVQLAVIGFIGFCGVVQAVRPDNPERLQVWAGIFALVELVLVLSRRSSWAAWPGRCSAAVSRTGTSSSKAAASGEGWR